MKKNLMLKRIIASTVACVALMGVTAVAQEVSSTENLAPIVDETAADSETMAKEEAYTVYEGKVTAVAKNDDGSIRVTIDGDNPIIANLQEGTYVIDADEPSLEGMSISDITEGMEVSLVIPSNSPMALSMPPQTSSVKAVVVKGETGFFEIASFDENLVNTNNTLKLNISEDTTIADVRGARKVFTAEDVKNSQSIVFYTVSTRSIPAQTTPAMIFILDNAEISGTEVKEAGETGERSIEPVTATAAELVALRDKAVELGFTVDWTSNSEPITLNKEDLSIEVSIGASSYTVNGEEKELTLSTELQDGKTFVSSEIFE